MREKEKLYRITAKGRVAVALSNALKTEGLPHDLPLVMKLLDAISAEEKKIWEVVEP
jgi:hypothetical protein